MITHSAPPPPGMVRMQSGRIVPMSKSFAASQKKTKRFLIVMSFYEGDKPAAEETMGLIADLERTRNHEADVLLVRRADSREMGSTIVNKLKAKFDKVLSHTCRRTDAKSYPMGPNQMFSDLIGLITTNYSSDYFAFVNLEGDMVPTRPGWISELIAAWTEANARGVWAFGHIHDNPRPHLNGGAVYSTDIARRVGGNRLLGCSPQLCYDIAFAPMILPHAEDNPLIYFRYRIPTISPEELFAARKQGVVPALFHGVKDGTARAAVKARHITFTERQPIVIVHKASSDLLAVSEPADPKSFQADDGIPALDEAAPAAIEPPSTPAVAEKRPNVYTYVFTIGKQSIEGLAIIEAWRKGWTAAGWNPVVLTIREAAAHPKFDEMSLAIDKLPYVGDRKRQQAMFYRWLALDLKGGGLMVDFDVLPRGVVLKNITEGDPVLLTSDLDRSFLGMWFSPGSAKDWIEYVLKYDAKPSDLIADKPHVSDGTIACNAVEIKPRVISPSPVESFASTATGTGRVSVAMEKFLASAQ